LIEDASGKRFLNSRVIISPELRDEYRLMRIGLAPGEKSELQETLYSAAIKINDLQREKIQLKRELRNYPIEHIEEVADVLFPDASEEFLRIKGVLKKGEKGMEPIIQELDKTKNSLYELKERLHEGEVVYLDEE